VVSYFSLVRVVYSACGDRWKVTGHDVVILPWSLPDLPENLQLDTLF